MTIRAKVIDIGDTNILADGRRVQNILVSDHTESAELALWETFINACEANESYKFTHLKVKIYREQYFLFTPRENTKIEKIADLENVVQRQSNSIKRTTEIEEAKIIAVSIFSTFSRCISCRDGCILPMGDDEPFGRCTECSTTLRMDSCPKHTSALLMLESLEERSVKLLALNNRLSQIP